MEALLSQSRAQRPALTIPQITELLWRIANETRPNPEMADFVGHIIAAIEELMALRMVAHAVMLERDREIMAAALAGLPDPRAHTAATVATDAVAHRSVPEAEVRPGAALAPL